MKPAGGKWDDLTERFLSGTLMSAVGVAAIWAGGIWFAGLVMIVTAVLVWELARMLGAGDVALPLAAAAAAAFAVAAAAPPSVAVVVLLLPVIGGARLLGRHGLSFGIFALLTLVAAYGLFRLRAEIGLIWMVWLIVIVAATDVFGYFAGRVIGGPKFWPRVSPKKTWAGTAAGWIASGAVGGLYWALGASGPGIVLISVAISMASQLGDIAESAMKRRMGVKDSSNLLPGHGGVFDRFDGVVGAAVFLLFVEQVAVFPPVGV